MRRETGGIRTHDHEDLNLDSEPAVDSASRTTAEVDRGTSAATVGFGAYAECDRKLEAVVCLEGKACRAGLMAQRTRRTDVQPLADYSKHHSVAAGDSRFRIAGRSIVTPLIWTFSCGQTSQGVINSVRSA